MFLWYITIYLSIFAVVLHPSHKLEYFKKANWDDEWRETAVDIVRTEFERAYADIEVDEVVDNDNVCIDFVPVALLSNFVVTGRKSFQFRQHIRCSSNYLSPCESNAREGTGSLPRGPS